MIDATFFDAVQLLTSTLSDRLSHSDSELINLKRFPLWQIKRFYPWVFVLRRKVSYDIDQTVLYLHGNFARQIPRNFCEWFWHGSHDTNFAERHASSWIRASGIKMPQFFWIQVEFDLARSQWWDRFIDLHTHLHSSFFLQLHPKIEGCISASTINIWRSSLVGASAINILRSSF